MGQGSQRNRGPHRRGLEGSRDRRRDAKTLSAGLVAAAPHVSRVADALGDTAKEVRETAETAPQKLSVISLAAGVVVVAIAITRSWRRGDARRRKAA